MSDTWSTVKSTIGTIAPAIATAIGSPLIGTAVKGICNVLGLSEESKPMEIKNAFNNATAAQLIEIEKLNMEMEVKIAELDIKREQIHQTDRASARTSFADKKDYTQQVLIVLLFCGFFSILSFIVFKQNISDVAKSLLEISIGYIMSDLSKVISYYFGSSADSRKKTDLLSKIK